MFFSSLSPRKSPVGKRRLLRALLCACCTAGAVIAFLPQGHARPEMAGRDAEARFAAMDADRNGRVSREEFFAAQPQMKEAAFSAIDADRDDSITPQEWELFSSGHGKSGQSSGETTSRMPPASGPKPGSAMPELLSPPARTE
jgi:hypothetical protein